MERLESSSIRKESWQIIKELALLDEHELRARLQSFSPQELEATTLAILEATGGSDGAESALQTQHMLADKAHMHLSEFEGAIGRIESALGKSRR